MRRYFFMGAGDLADELTLTLRLRKERLVETASPALQAVLQVCLLTENLSLVSCQGT